MIMDIYSAYYAKKYASQLYFNKISNEIRINQNLQEVKITQTPNAPRTIFKTKSVSKSM